MFKTFWILEDLAHVLASERELSLLLANCITASVIAVFKMA